MTPALRTVAFYGESGGDYLFDSVYSYKSFCGGCERELPDGFYPHLGARYCPYCGTTLDERTDLEDGGPRSIHPLVQKEHNREAVAEAEEDRKKYEQPDPAAPRCDKCSTELLFAHGDEEYAEMQIAHSDAPIMCMYVAAKITCKGCERVLHNCTPRWNGIGKPQTLACGAGEVVGSLDGPSNPSDPYGLHVSVPRVGRRTQ